MKKTMDNQIIELRYIADRCAEYVFKYSIGRVYFSNNEVTIISEKTNDCVIKFVLEKENNNFENAKEVNIIHKNKWVQFCADGNGKYNKKNEYIKNEIYKSIIYDELIFEKI